MSVEVSASLAVVRPPFIARRHLGAALFVALAFAGCGGTVDTRPQKWSFISAAIIQPSCATANCHSQLAMRSGVALDSVYDGYDQLINRHFVKVGDPDGSALIGLLRGQGSRRMPPDFPLPDLDIALIANWIAAGATWDLSSSTAPPTSSLTQ